MRSISEGRTSGKEEGADEDGDRLRAELAAALVMLREDGNEVGEVERRRRTWSHPLCQRLEAARSLHDTQTVVACGGPDHPRCADPDNARHLPPLEWGHERWGASEPPGTALEPFQNHPGSEDSAHVGAVGLALEPFHNHPGGGEAGCSARAEAAPESLPLLQGFRTVRQGTQS